MGDTPRSRTISTEDRMIAQQVTHNNSIVKPNSDVLVHREIVIYYLYQAQMSTTTEQVQWLEQ
ncbi:MAG: hypothetical protein HQK62_08225 [Desulfamplus sp.]|nr:hypothetical protein [Desulfamplus sp.]